MQRRQGLASRRGILGSSQNPVVLPGGGETEWVQVSGTPGEWVAWKEAEASGEGQGGPSLHTWPASSPPLPPGTAAGAGLAAAGQCRAQQRAQALLTLHRGLRVCISHQRLRLLHGSRLMSPRGLQARCGALDCRPPQRGRGRLTGRHRASMQVCLPASHRHWTLLADTPAHTSLLSS